jgi:RNA recognition motif-containing protein
MCDNKVEEDDDDEDDNDDDDDDELLAAAAMWAGDGDGDSTSNIQSSSNEKDNRKNDSSTNPKTTDTTTLSPPPPPFQRKQVYSLHITQLPYDSTEFDLRKLFAEHGCSITSIRLVYDRDTQGHKTVFRGVAFIDMYDSNSFEVALKLHHRTSIRGRKLNVRPCRSKEELAEIVERTKELVTEKIRHQRMLERGDGDGGVATSGESSSSNKNWE